MYDKLSGAAINSHGVRDPSISEMCHGADPINSVCNGKVGNLHESNTRPEQDLSGGFTKERDTSHEDE